MVSLEYFAPAQDVRSFVSGYYLFEVSQEKFADRERAAVAQLRFLLEGSGSVEFADGETYRAKDATLQGPSTGATHFRAEGPFRMFGAGILPRGWSIATSKSASEYVDRLVPASDVFTTEVDKNLPVLRACKTGEEMVAWADKIFRSLKLRLKPETVEFTQMIDEWLTSAHSPPVSDLMRRSPQSSRQVLRLVNKLYGMPPKYLARKYRALRAAQAYAEGNNEEIVELLDAFYDQSHMIREVKYFAGVTPNQLRLSDGEFSRPIDQHNGLSIDHRPPLRGRVTS